MTPVLSRRERNRSLSHRRLVRAAAGDNYTVLLFNPHVPSIIGEKLSPEKLPQLSNVIKHYRADINSEMDGPIIRKYFFSYAFPKTAEGRPDRKAIDAFRWWRTRSASLIKLSPRPVISPAIS
jgi:hypothetical protein